MHVFALNQRLVTGLALAVVFAAAVAFGGWVARIVLLAATSIALWEFYSMFWADTKNIALKIVGVLCGAGYVLSFDISLGWAILFLGIALCIMALVFLFDFGTGNPNAKLTDYTPLPLGLVYIPLLLSLILPLSRSEQVLVVLAAIATDAGGYYVGSALGKHKMWPSVSPKKSWQGAAGGMVACVVICVSLGIMQGAFSFDMPVLPWWMWVVVGCLLNVAAQLGDFFESAVKRSLGVKDAGFLLPGHGGFLDRVDSLIFVVPVYSVVHLVSKLFTGA